MQPILVRWFRGAALTALAALLSPTLAWSQQTGLGGISGEVLDVDGEPVAGAFVAAVRASADAADARSTLTDTRGRFQLPGLTPDSYTVRVRRLGYGAESVTVVVRSGEVQSVRVRLPPDAVVLEEILVEGVRGEDRERRRFEQEAGVTSRVVGGDDLRALPGLAEPDVLRAVELLPGVISTSDFSSAFNVRGGSADQNLVLLDGFPVFNPFHLGGIFSVFNSDAVARAELFSGGFGAEYGGRVSSVLNVETRLPDGEGLQLDGGVSLLSSRLTARDDFPERIDGLLGGEGGGWMFSARRSYFDVLLRPVVDFPYHLTDLQGSVTLGTRGGGRLRFTGYAGGDVLDLTDFSLPHGEETPAILRFAWDWGNEVAGLHWEQPFGDDWRLDARLGHSRFATELGFVDFDDITFASRIGQWTARADLGRRFSDALQIRSGVEVSRLSYDNLTEAGGTTFFDDEDQGVPASAYAEIQWRPNGRWIVEPGVRVDGWSGQSATYVIPGPRLAVKRFLGADSVAALKASVGRYSQFLHSLRDEELPFSIDTWVLADDGVPPVVSDQVQAGVEWFPADGWLLSADVYARDFRGVTDFNPADDPNDPTDGLLEGTGSAYGLDLFARRSRGEFTGWLALSLLRAERTFPDPFVTTGDGLRPEVTYPPIFDRRVSLDLVARYMLPWSLEASGRWNLGTGLPYTRPVGQAVNWGYGLDSGRHELRGGGDDGRRTAPRFVVLGERNAERYPTYHRLDLSLRRTFEPRWGSLTPYVQVLNVYDQRNTLFYFFNYGRTPPTRSGIGMFPVLPTLGVEVSF